MVPRSTISITIPNSVTRIGDVSFFETELTNGVIPNSVTSIGEYAFSRTRLTTVIIPNSVTSIANNAFFGTPLTSVTIPNSVTHIGSYAFTATQLKSVTIPNSVTTIGEGAFDSNGSGATSDALANNPNHLVIREGTTKIINDWDSRVSLVANMLLIKTNMQVLSPLVIGDINQYIKGYRK